MTHRLTMFLFIAVLLAGFAHAGQNTGATDYNANENDPATCEQDNAAVNINSKNGANHDGVFYINLSNTTAYTLTDVHFRYSETGTGQYMADTVDYYYCNINYFPCVVYNNVSSWASSYCNPSPFFTQAANALNTGGWNSEEFTTEANNDSDRVMAIYVRFTNRDSGTQPKMYFEGQGAAANVWEIRYNATPGGGGTTAITVYHESPANNTHNNTPLVNYYNVSKSANCTLYINNTVNDTQADVAANTTLYFNTGFSVDGNYSYYVNCSRTDGGNDTTGRYNYIYDTTQPFITANNVQQNVTTQTEYNISIYCTDDYLYWANLSILNASGKIFYNNDTNVSALGWDRFDFNHSLDNITSFPVGKYYYNVTCWDSHTDAYIRPAKRIEKSTEQKQIKYTLDDEELTIKLTSAQEVDNIDTEKLTDRYTFDFKLKTATTQDLVYRVKTKNKKIRPANTGIKGHMVVGLDYWVDFEGVDGTTQITPISAYEYEVRVRPKSATKDMKFRSFGALNVNSEYGEAFVKFTNISIMVNDTNTGDLIKNWSYTAYHSIDGQFGATYFVNNTNVSLLWVEPSITYVYNFSKSGYVIPDVSKAVTAPYNLTVNASSSGVTISVYDEQTLALITGTTVTIGLIGNTTAEYTTSTGTKTISGLNSGPYEFKYTAEGYYPRSYYTTLNFSAVQQVYLYMLNSSEGSRVIHTVYNEDSDRLEDVTVNLLRWYTSSNEYKVVQMQKTNFEGQVALYVELYNTYYKLRYTDGNTSYKTTNTTYWFETETEDTISTTEDEFASWRGWDNGFHNLTFVNSSGTIYARYSFFVSGGLVQTGCLHVQRYTTSAVYDICNNCTNASQAILTCVLDSSLPGEYKAVGYIDTNTENSPYTPVVEWWQKLTSTAIPKQEGIFMTAIFVGTFAIVGLSSISGSILLTITALVVASVIGIAYGIGMQTIVFIALVGFLILIITRRAGGA